MFTTALFYFSLALVLALTEIEIEGKYGWAEKLPTWYRTKGFGKLFGLFTQSRPLTGYHLFMNVFILLMIHIGFFNGAKWTIGTELTLISRYLIFAISWDFLWFVFNPEYGIRNFRKTKIWWHSKCRWFGGFIPADYLMAIGTSIILTSTSRFFEGPKNVFGHLMFIGLMVVFIAISIPNLAPLYKWWYGWMRRKDERSNAGIFHNNSTQDSK